MKNKLFVVVIFLLGYSTVYAQSKGINFQSIVVDASGAIEVSQEVDFKFDFYYNSDLSTVIYSETQSKTTNNKGLVSLVIGDGTKLSAGTELADLDWSEEITLKVSRQVSGSYQLLFTQTVASVPIAFYAKKAGSLEGVTVASGVVSATGFKGDGSELTNLNVSSSVNSSTHLDENDNLFIGTNPEGIIVESGTISGVYNTGIGKNSLLVNTNGYSNTALGF